jgi:hypothetical protein
MLFLQHWMMTVVELMQLEVGGYVPREV